MVEASISLLTLVDAALLSIRCAYGQDTAGIPSRVNATSRFEAWLTSVLGYQSRQQWGSIRLSLGCLPAFDLARTTQTRGLIGKCHVTATSEPCHAMPYRAVPSHLIATLKAPHAWAGRGITYCAQRGAFATMQLLVSSVSCPFCPSIPSMKPMMSSRCIDVSGQFRATAGKYGSRLTNISVSLLIEGGMDGRRSGLAYLQ
jgi:hypothetical protein